MSPWRATISSAPTMVWFSMAASMAASIRLVTRFLRFAETLTPDPEEVKLNRETRSASAGCDGIRILNLKRLTDQIIDEIDLCAAHEFKAEGIDQDCRGVFLEDQVVLIRGFLHEIVFVLETRAAAAGHGYAQDGAGSLFRQD